MSLILFYNKIKLGWYQRGTIMPRFNYILFISLFFIITPFLLFKYLDLNDFKTGKSIQVESITNGKLSKQISKLNFPFIKNQGQFSENVTFAANTPKPLQLHMPLPLSWDADSQDL